MEGRQVYYGTKRVEAEPRRAGVVHNVATEREHVVDTPGYIVIDDGGDEEWWPAPVFEAAYRPSSCMGFEGALAAMREGRKVRRIGIDAEGVSIWLADGAFWCQREGSYAGQWWPNQQSLLADWMIVEAGAEHTGWAG